MPDNEGFSYVIARMEEQFPRSKLEFDQETGQLVVPGIGRVKIENRGAWSLFGGPAFALQPESDHVDTPEHGWHPFVCNPFNEMDLQWAVNAVGDFLRRAQPDD